ncbi:hypothetical protein [Pseudomonas sp. Irchel 3A7]|uniref:hypothetical protein n=1 Tax=Pseudomonas sp. Irchel 3A7 TaxID=2008913 RepID=UPI000BA46679|nr:hypothetical protein [Pseudomonas sp. Irchel 3A7]
MKSANKTPRSFDSNAAKQTEQNLRALLKAPSSQFAFLASFEQQLRQAELAEKQANGYEGPAIWATKSIVAATIGAERFTDLPKLLLKVDEDIPLSTVNKRRKQQAANLCAYIIEQATLLELTPPEKLLLLCDSFIEVWQPMMYAPDAYPETLLRVARAKASGELPALFTKVAAKLDAASSDESLPLHNKTVYEALSLLKIADEESLTTAHWGSRSWLAMREDLGIAAVRMANTRESTKTIRAALILEHLWEQGIVYAGVQLARMYFHVVSPNRVDKTYAAEVIDAAYSEYKSEPIPSSIFTMKDSEAELFQTYNTIKTDAVQHAQDPDDVLKFSKQMIEAALTAAGHRFEGFAAFVLSILTPDFAPMQNAENEVFFKLREKISTFPMAEAYCQQMAQSSDIAALKQRF